MECITPPPLTDETLSLVLDGLTDADTQQHLARCPACAARLANMRRFDTMLLNRLWRFECPTPQELGDYYAGMLDAQTAAAIGEHLERCPICQDELKTLDEFVKLDSEAVTSEKIIPLSPAPNVWTARHVQTSGSLALKGAEDAKSHDVRAGSASVFLETKAVPKGFVLSGQVVDSQVNWAEAMAELWQEDAPQQFRILDETCEFSFELSKTTPITLYITAASGVTLVVENITIQS